MAYYNNQLKTHEMVQALTEAIVGHTPENIKAAGEAARAEIQLTSDQQAAYDEALEVIKHAQATRDEIKAAEAFNVTEKASLAVREAKVKDTEAACDKRLESLNTYRAKLDAQASEQDTEAKRLSGWAADLKTLGDSLYAKQTELKTLEKNLKAKQDKLRAAAAD